jgi:hypothetical protein
LNPDITNPLPDQFDGSYNFQHVSPTLHQLPGTCRDCRCTRYLVFRIC